MLARGKLISVLGVVALGAMALIASTQAWYFVDLHEVIEHPLEVTGTAALPVLAPLGLAAMAMAGALGIVGRALRFVFGVLTLALGSVLTAMVAPLAFSVPVTAVASTVTEATFITGDASITALVASVTPTAWPGITLAVGVLIAVLGVFILVSSRRWQGGGRRFAGSAGVRAQTSGPVDAIDGWDGLSLGIDPTGGGDSNTPPPAR